jgi:hypothetical protein
MTRNPRSRSKASKKPGKSLRISKVDRVAYLVPAKKIIAETLLRFQNRIQHDITTLKLRLFKEISGVTLIHNVNMYHFGCFKYKNTDYTRYRLYINKSLFSAFSFGISKYEAGSV